MSATFVRLPTRQLGKGMAVLGRGEPSGEGRSALRLSRHQEGRCVRRQRPGTEPVLISPGFADHTGCVVIW